MWTVWTAKQVFLVRKVDRTKQKFSNKNIGLGLIGFFIVPRSALLNLQTLLNSIECDLVVNFDKIQDLILMHLFPTLRVLTN